MNQYNAGVPSLSADSFRQYVERERSKIARKLNETADKVISSIYAMLRSIGAANIKVLTKDATKVSYDQKTKLFGGTLNLKLSFLTGKGTKVLELPLEVKEGCVQLPDAKLLAEKVGALESDVDREISSLKQTQQAFNEAAEKPTKSEEVVAGAQIDKKAYSDNALGVLAQTVRLAACHFPADTPLGTVINLEGTFYKLVNKNEGNMDPSNGDGVCWVFALDLSSTEKDPKIHVSL